MKVSKGSRGYIRSQKKIRILTTVLLFGLVFFLFALGLKLNHGDRKNVFSIAAAVLCIPGAMSATGMIVIWLQEKYAGRIPDALTEGPGSVRMLYELYITTREASLLLDAVMVSAGQVLAFSCDPKTGALKKAVEDHLYRNLSNIVPDIRVEILDDPEEFSKRIQKESGPDAEDEGGTEDELAGVLLALSM